MRITEMPADRSEDSPAAIGDPNRLDVDSFAPPADFEYGSEFSAEPPRSLPDFVRRSRYVRARHATAWTLLTIGSVCWATKQLPFVQELSWYLLPLGYLNWIALALLALAAFYRLREALRVRRILEPFRRIHCRLHDGGILERVFRSKPSAS
jgi:hypothetical protein